MLLDQARSVEAGSLLGGACSDLRRRLEDCRQLSLELVDPLSAEDQVVQAMEDASPTKWHLAHTTWFFEELVLKPYADGYQIFDERFSYCFNSYYETLGARHPRPKRGLLTRPGLQQVHDYRHYVDDALAAFFDRNGDKIDHEICSVILTGINHEQQHQELLLMDILAVFAQQPLRPAYLEVRGGPPGGVSSTDGATDLEWVSFDGGLVDIGYDGDGFAYDNEGPRHQQFLQDFKLANRLVTNSEWLSFMEDDGYRTATLWLSDGWSRVLSEGWEAPLYWEKRDGVWYQMTLRGGLRAVDPSAPVSHVSYYEADAFARWAGKRLPTEFEWEAASSGLGVEGNFVGSSNFTPVRAQPGSDAGGGLQQMFGDLWEWTRSAYSPYNGYQPPCGAIGEYNGKFMCNQFVLKGGACVTPDGHVRPTYRNFFYPHNRWQFGGLRLAAGV